MCVGSSMKKNYDTGKEDDHHVHGSKNLSINVDDIDIGRRDRFCTCVSLKWIRNTEAKE